MPVSPIAKGAAATLTVATTAAAGVVAGLSVEAFLAMIVTLNALELGLIVRNTALVNRVGGRVDGAHGTGGETS